MTKPKHAYAILKVIEMSGYVATVVLLSVNHVDPATITLLAGNLIRFVNEP